MKKKTNPVAKVAELPRLSFATAAACREWLAKNHATSPGIWLRFFKKKSGRKTVTYAEALDQALCFGWIDGLVRKCDEHSYIQKFTPRRPKSSWSKRNTGHVQRLIQAGQMTAAGLRAVEAAQADGRWAAAYDSPGQAAPPKYFLDALSRNKTAQAFFATLNKTNIYSIVYRLQTARSPELREKRLAAILAMLARREKFHP